MAFAYSPKIVTDGLVFAVDAANKKSYPGSGITWSDLSVNGNNGTLTNGPTFDSGNGGSIVLDGTNDYIDFGNIGITLYCIDIWYYLTSEITGASGFKPFFRFSNQGVQEGVGFGAVTGFLSNETLTMLGQTPGYERTGIFDVIPSGWNNFVFNWNGSNYDIFLNSSQKTVSYGTANSGHVSLISSTGFYLGQGYQSSQIGDGKFSSTKIYNKALSSTEISQNYNALKSRFGL